MNAKYKLVPAILFVFVCFSCKKNNPSVVNPTAAVSIDSIVGYYQGITTGDSIYTYIDSNNKVQQGVHSFSWTDTLIVTSPDTASIKIVSKYYTATFPYGDSLTFNSTTYLQNEISGNGYAVSNATFYDVAAGINQVTITVGYNYTKNLNSNVTLYKRQ